jgi:hypothetical protein
MVVCVNYESLTLEYGGNYMKNTWKPTCGGYIPSDNDNIVDMKTIAQQLNIKEFPFEIKDSNGNQIYYENSDGFWIKREFDSNGNQIYSENSNGYWCKREYDSKGNQIYSEDSDGTIKDNRPKSSCNGKVVEIDGKKYKLTELSEVTQ